MVTRLKNDREQRAEKAIALLTLAADKEEMIGSCLSDQEMAVLAEGRSRGDVLQKHLAHLGSCAKCYGEWLFLKKSIRQDAHRGRLYHLGRLRKFGYIGTALAAAASIAVYLNVVKMEDKAGEQAVLSAPQITVMQDKNLAAPPSLPSAAEREQDEPARVAAKTPMALPAAPAAPAAIGSGAVKGRPETQPVPRQSLEKPQEERQKPAAATPARMAREEAKEMAKDAAPPLAKSLAATAIAPVLEDIDGWLEQLRTACSSGIKDHLFWQEMADRGARLRDLPTVVSKENEVRKLLAVLALLQGMSGPDTESQQCHLILVELAKDSGSR